MNVNTVKSELNRYGYKGACSIIQTISIEDKNNLTVDNTYSDPVKLLSRVTSYPSSRIDNKLIFANDRKVLAAPDKDWDGTISPDSEITIDDERYNIIAYKAQKEKQVILFVEIQVRG